MKNSFIKYNRQEIAGTMGKVAAFMKTLPPSEKWQAIRPLLNESFAISFERKWKFVGHQLEAFYLDLEGLPMELLTSEEQRFIKVYTNYYSQLGIVIFEAFPLLKKEFMCGSGEQQGIEFPERRSALLKAMVLEDCLGAIDSILLPFWESPSEKEFKQLWQVCIDYINGAARVGGKVKSLEQLNHEEWKELHQQISAIYQKLNWSISKTDKFSFWNDLCTKVFRDNRKELPAFSGWIEAKNQKSTIDKWRKHFWQDGRRTNFPGRKKAKKNKLG